MIIACPQCGKENTIPDSPDSGTRYRCGNCMAVLWEQPAADTEKESPKPFIPVLTGKRAIIGLALVMTSLVAIIVVIVVLSLGGSSESDFTLKVTGTEGLRFSGNYVVMTEGGTPSSKTVESEVPAEFEVNGDTVSAVFQKTSEQGILTVELFKDGTLIKQATTSAPYGNVLVATD